MTIVKIMFTDGIIETHECDSVTINSKEDFVDLFDADGEDLCSFNFSGIRLIKIANSKEITND